METENTNTQLLLTFLGGAFISTCIHHLISYLARRKKPIRFVFFLWIGLVISIAIRFHTLLTGAEPVLQPFVLQILEMSIMACMASHLTYNEAARYIKYIFPVSIMAFCLFWFFPEYLIPILGVVQLMAILFIGYLTYQLYLQKKPYFNLLLGATVVALTAFTFFGVGPVGFGSLYPVSSRITLLAFYLISFILHATYLNRMSALTSQKFVESEFNAHSLKELDRLKTKFFSNITHEFRTPLTLIQGPANELLEKTSDPEAKKLLTMIKNNSARLLTLINQLLDLTRLDAKEVKLTYSAARPDTLLRSIIAQFTSLASSRSIQLDWRISEVAQTVLIDKEKVETILINLISNAIKFTSSGGKVFVISTFNNNILEIEVNDNGRGIPAEKLPHIFDRFYQVEATDSSHAEGTGIGLALVKEYVELMKGVIQVESKVGLGTSIKISLTVAHAPYELKEESTKAIEQNVLTNEVSLVSSDELPLLLLVEDNEDILSYIKTCLGNQYRYSEARHGREGLDKAQSEIPDIIISDLMMPEMDGIKLCQEIKNDTRTNHIPFIMLTAKAAEESKMEGLQTGADDYIIKPFNKTELVLKVHNLVLLREKLQAHIKNSLLGQGSAVVATSVNEKFIVNAKRFIESHLKDEKLSVETLSEELHLSREQCYRKISALTGISPSAFIRKLRMQKAAQLLASKWGLISQIAYEVGYDNLSYFSKAFKEEFGKLPSEYVD